MHRTDGANHSSNMFVDKVPGVSPGTIVEEDWLNAVQEEIRSVIVEDGTALIKGTNTQLRDAISKMRRVTAVSRVLHLSAVDFVPILISGVVDTRLNSQLSSGAHPGYWRIAAGSSTDFYFNARLRGLPIGATITGVKVYVFNSGGSAGNAILGDVRVRTLTYAASATGDEDTPYTVLEAQAVGTSNTIGPGVGAWCTPTGLWTNRTVPSDGFVEMGLRITPSDGFASLVGARLTYTEQVIAPAT